jgi:hypothetical protein
MSRADEKVFPEFTEIHVIVKRPRRNREGFSIPPDPTLEGMELAWVDMAAKDMDLKEFEEFVAKSLRQAYVALGRGLAIHFFKLPNGNFSDFNDRLGDYDERMRGTACYILDPVKGLVEAKPAPTIAEQL